MANIGANAPQNIGSWGSKEYIIGFDDQGKILTKRLNIFQRIVRRIFGCYSETHLSTVLSLATKKIFKADWTFADGAAPRIMLLFKKKDLQMENASFNRTFPIGTYSTEIDNKKVTFALEYDDGWRMYIRNDTKYGIFLTFAKSKLLPNALEIRDFGTSIGIDHETNKMSQEEKHDLAFSIHKNNLHLFLQHILQHSSKVEKFCFDDKDKALISKLIDADKFIEEKTENGSVWTLSKDAANGAEALNIDPISFDFLLAE